MKQYKVVVQIEFIDGHEEFVVWEPELFGSMLYGGIDLYDFFYDQQKNKFQMPPVNVKIELYNNPKVQDVIVRIGDTDVIRQILYGDKVIPLGNY